MVPPPRRRNSLGRLANIFVVLILIAAGGVFWFWHKGLIGESFSSLHRRAAGQTNYQVDVTDEEDTYTVLRVGNRTRITAPAEAKLEIYQDLSRRKSYYFDREAKQYYEQTLQAATATDLKDPYRNFDFSSARPLRRDKVGIKEVRVFVARDSTDNQEVTLWIDSATGFILKREDAGKVILSSYNRLGEIKTEEVTLPKDVQKVEPPAQP